MQIKYHILITENAFNIIHAKQNHDDLYLEEKNEKMEKRSLMQNWNFLHVLNL